MGLYEHFYEVELNLKTKKITNFFDFDFTIIVPYRVRAIIDR